MSISWYNIKALHREFPIADRAIAHVGPMIYRAALHNKKEATEYYQDVAPAFL